MLAKILLSMLLNQAAKLKTLNVFFLSAKKMTAKTTRALIWACLVHEDSALTLEQVGALLNPKNSLKVSMALNRALLASAPESGEDEEGDDGKNVLLPTG